MHVVNNKDTLKKKKIVCRDLSRKIHNIRSQYEILEKIRKRRNNIKRFV